MAPTRGRARAALIERLLVEPHDFAFFQAVRLLEAFAPSRARIGHDGPPHAEAVRFSTEASLAFPASEVLAVDRDDDGAPPRMIERVMGLIGPQAALPHHYTELVIKRVRERRDRTLWDFLDLLNHRLVSLFYRSWTKYRAWIHVRREVDDALSLDLFALVGLRTRGLRGRLAVPDRALLHYAGLLAQRPRSAVGLEILVSDWFHGVPARVSQFIPQWLRIDPQSRTSLSPLAGNNRLGVDAVLGSRVRDTQSRFRVRLGPLTWTQLNGFLPTGRASRELVDLVKLWAGLTHDAEFQLVVRADELRPARLGGGGPGASRLGWSTWLLARPAQADADDVVLDGATLEAWHARSSMEDAA